HLLHESASRSRSANEAKGDGSSRGTAKPDWSAVLAMVRDRIPHRRGRHLGDQHAESVKLGVDGAGRARKREVAVVTRVRRMDGSRQPVVRALREQVTLRLRAPGV